MRFVLVHSPLVGPATWRWVAQTLTSGGHEVAVPDLREGAVTGRPQAVITAALPTTTTDCPVIVGHSGAGFLLPSIAACLESPVRRIIFVDAGIPPCEGRATTSADFLDHLRTLAVDGVLPRWSTWWGERVMEMLVPNEARRAAIETEMPEIPLAFYESPITVPVGWCDTPSAFLLLSDAYRRDADTASSLGWRVIERLGTHLDIVNEPEAIARHLVELAG